MTENINTNKMKWPLKHGRYSDVWSTGNRI